MTLRFLLTASVVREISSSCFLVAILLLGSASAAATSASRYLGSDIEKELLRNNLYGELNGYVVPVHHLVKGITRLDMIPWIDGSIFDSYSKDAQEKLISDLDGNENILGEFAYLKKALRENVKLQKELLHEEVQQSLKKYMTVDGPVRKARSGVLTVIKSTAIVALDYLFRFIRSKLNEGWHQRSMEDWRLETHQHFQEHLFRTNTHMLLSQVREKIVQDFNVIMDDLFHRNKLSELLSIEAALEDAVEDLLGSFYTDSIFQKHRGKAMHAIRAVIVDIKGFHIYVQVEIPLALMRERRPLVHILDLGSFSEDNKTFELDYFPTKYFCQGRLPVKLKIRPSDSLSQWRAVHGPCTTVANLFICENVLPVAGNCQLNFSLRSGCAKERLPASETFTFVRRMTHAYLVATNHKQGNLSGNGQATDFAVPFESPVFTVKLGGNQQLSVGEHQLKGLFELRQFSIHYGQKKIEQLMEKGEAQALHSYASVPQDDSRPFVALGASVLLLLVVMVISHCYFLRKIRASLSAADSLLNISSDNEKGPFSKIH